MSDNNSTPRPFRIGLTHGDINGTSYEVILKAFNDTRMMSTMTPILYGQSKALSYYKKNFGMDDFNYSLTRDARQSWNQKFNILNIIDQELKIEPGTATEVSAEMAVLSHKKATEDLRDGYIDALVMAPAYRPIERTNLQYLFSFYKDAETGIFLACNQAVASTIGTEFADYDIFLLNNDTVMTSTVLPKMISALNSAQT